MNAVEEMNAQLDRLRQTGLEIAAKLDAEDDLSIEPPAMSSNSTSTVNSSASVDDAEKLTTSPSDLSPTPEPSKATP